MKETEHAIDALQKPVHIFDMIVQETEKNFADCSEAILWMGLTLPGPYLEQSERIILMTESPDWEDFDIVHRLRKHFSIKYDYLENKMYTNQNLPIWWKSKWTANSNLVWIFGMFELDETINEI